MTKKENIQRTMGEVLSSNSLDVKKSIRLAKKRKKNREEKYSSPHIYPPPFFFLLIPLLGLIPPVKARPFSSFSF